MAESNDKRPVLAVVGPTATGKTALGVELALRLGGEIISADSMQVYRGLDVGTAKVTPEETRGVPHHCVDILPPEEPFSVADFTALAGRLVEEIAARGHLPILVGGTGLYVQSFLYGVRFTEGKGPRRPAGTAGRRTGRPRPRRALQRAAGRRSRGRRGHPPQ